MWSTGVTFDVPAAEDRDHLAQIAGMLVEALEDLAGDAAPVVVASYRAEQANVVIDIDVKMSEPSTAVSDALRLIDTAARIAGVTLGDVHTISLSVAEGADRETVMASAG